MICNVNVKLSKSLELKFEQLVFENWTDCNFWQTDFISFDRWNLEHSKTQNHRMNRLELLRASVREFLTRITQNLGLKWSRPWFGFFWAIFPISKRRKVRPLFEVMDSSFVESIYSANFYGFFKFLQIWNLENDILIFQYGATVAKFSLLFQSSLSAKDPRPGKVNWFFIFISVLSRPVWSLVPCYRCDEVNWGQKGSITWWGDFLEGQKIPQTHYS